MLYSVYVHLGDEKHAHSVTIPDFPGCFSAANDWDLLPSKIQEAVELYCEGEDMEIPLATPLEELVKNPDFKDGVWLLVDVDIAKLLTKPVTINVDLPENLVKRIDRYAEEHQITRSGFLTRAALAEMQKGV
ncbi:MAG: type II toxin-antitoxin system HicB family antitoxin [Candidatus Methylumidiphilus sp.]